MSVHALPAHTRTDGLGNSAIASHAKECDAQGRDKHALAKFLTMHPHLAKDTWPCSSSCMHVG